MKTISNFSASPLKAPIAADFDGDKKDDPGVIDSTSNEGLNWQIKQSSGSILFAFAGQGGINFDYPILGDFNGDGKNDLTTWTPGTGTYTVSLPNNQIIRTRWGMRGDKPLTAGKVIQVTGGGDIIVSAF